MKQIKFPKISKTLADKLEFVYRAQELLRLEHNVMGKDFRDGKIIFQEWGIYKDQFKIKNYILGGFIGTNRTKVMEDILNISFKGSDEAQQALIQAKKKKFKNSKRFNIKLDKLWQ